MADPKSCLLVAAPRSGAVPILCVASAAWSETAQGLSPEARRWAEVQGSLFGSGGAYDRALQQAQGGQ